MLSILSKPCRVEEETQGGSSELDFNYCLRQSELQAAEQETFAYLLSSYIDSGFAQLPPPASFESAGLIVLNTLLLLFCAWSKLLTGQLPRLTCNRFPGPAQISKGETK
jgi:hypothetical protein